MSDQLVQQEGQGQQNEEKSDPMGSADKSSWNSAQENLLKAIAERSNCMRWLHLHCFYYFESANFYLTIPNVIISTLNGGVTMSLTSLFPDPFSQKAATTVIGLISIFSAMLITMNQYIKSQQMMESHRATGLSYSKLHRMITIELALRRDQRHNALDLIKHVRNEQDRLENTAPNIIPFVIEKFNKIFKDTEIEKPEIAGDLDAVNINNKLRDGTIVHSPDVNDSSPEDSPVSKPKSPLGNIFSRIVSPSIPASKVINNLGIPLPAINTVINSLESTSKKNLTKLETPSISVNVQNTPKQN